MDELQPNYALRTVVRHYRKTKQRRGGSGKGPASTKKKKKKIDGRTGVKCEKEEDSLSPFAFFNAWVNGKDKKAKEERQARQRGDENEEQVMPAETCVALSGGSANDTVTTTTRSASLSHNQRPDSDGVVLSGAWFDGFMDNLSTGGTSSESFVSEYASSATSTSEASMEEQRSLALIGDEMMVGFGVDTRGEEMGRVGFSSSLFSFDESPRETQEIPSSGDSDEEGECVPDDAEDEDESERSSSDTEEEEEEVMEEEEEEDDEDIEGTAVSADWPNKSETIVIGGKDDENQQGMSKKEMAAKMQSLLARFKALASSSERSDEERTEDTSMKVVARKSEDNELEEEQILEMRKSSSDGGAEPKITRNSKRLITDEDDETTESGSISHKDNSQVEKLRLGLEVEHRQLRYDMQHKGLLVISVRAPPAPSSLRNVSPLRDKVQINASSSSTSATTTHQKRPSSSFNMEDSIRPEESAPASGSSERAQVALIAAIDRSSSMKGTATDSLSNQDRQAHSQSP